MGRGFDTAFGYWSGAEDYTAHTVTQNKRAVYDMQNDLLADASANGTFSTPVFAARAQELIAAQGAAGPGAPPLFLYLAFQNVHWPLEAPADIVARFANSTGGNAGRAMVCAMAAYLDEAVGNVTRAITAAGLDENTIIIFVSDNGCVLGGNGGEGGGGEQPPPPTAANNSRTHTPHAHTHARTHTHTHTHAHLPPRSGPTHNDEGTWSNNFPLRGGKNTLWEGGTRVLAAVKGPGVTPGTALSAPVHATDWLASLVSAATGGADFRGFAPPGEPPYLDGDGLDVWATITGAAPTPQRDWLLLEAHNDGSRKDSTHGNGLIEWRKGGVLKYLLLGPEDPAIEDGWWAPDGEDAAATPYEVRCSWQGAGPRTGGANIPTLCTQTACLFNLTADPCEYFDVADANPGIVKAMAARLAAYSTVPPLQGQGCMPQIIDVAGAGGAVQFFPCDVTPP